jgi:hypothetical protein
VTRIDVTRTDVTCTDVNHTEVIRTNVTRTDVTRTDVTCTGTPGWLRVALRGTWKRGEREGMGGGEAKWEAFLSPPPQSRESPLSSLIDCLSFLFRSISFLPHLFTSFDEVSGFVSMFIYSFPPVLILNKLLITIISLIFKQIETTQL